MKHIIKDTLEVEISKESLEEFLKYVSFKVSAGTPNSMYLSKDFFKILRCLEILKLETISGTNLENLKVCSNLKMCSN